MWPLILPATAAPLSPSAVWTRSGGEESEHLGLDPTLAGDFDGDGFSDLVVPAERDDEVTQAPVAVDAAGDVDGDGHPDLLVGDYDWQGDDRGVLVVFPGGLEPTPGWIVSSPQEGDGLGRVVAGAGDVNGDGFADLLGGAPYHDAPDDRDGAVLLYLGGPAGPESEPAWQLEATGELDSLGRALDGAGDLDGDARDDVILGAYGGLYGGPSAAAVFLGVADGLAGEPAWSRRGGRRQGRVRRHGRRGGRRQRRRRPRCPRRSALRGRDGGVRRRRPLVRRLCAPGRGARGRPRLRHPRRVGHGHSSRHPGRVGHGHPARRALRVCHRALAPAARPAARARPPPPRPRSCPRLRWAWAVRPARVISRRAGGRRSPGPLRGRGCVPPSRACAARDRPAASTPPAPQPIRAADRAPVALPRRRSRTRAPARAC